MDGAHPKEARAAARNKSYVFFRETNLPVNEEPIGAQGISLTPGRSIAVDHKLHTYGTRFSSRPICDRGLKPTPGSNADDRAGHGGAIVGPARADSISALATRPERCGRLRHYGNSSCWCRRRFSLRRRRDSAASAASGQSDVDEAAPTETRKSKRPAQTGTRRRNRPPRRPSPSEPVRPNSSPKIDGKSPRRKSEKAAEDKNR